VVAGQAPVPSHQPSPRKAAAAEKSAATKPPAVAFVNGVPLLADRLKAAMNELMPYGAYHVGASAERVAKIRKQALDKLIDDELQYQEAKRLGLAAPRAKVDEEYARVRRHYKTEQEYIAALKRAGSSTAQVKAEAERRALISMAFEKSVTSKCGASEADARSYYDANTAKFVMPEQVHVYTLTLGVEPSAPREQWESARKKAEDLLARLRAGADFEALAREYSTDPNKENGGDLGYVHRGRLAEEFERALADAAPGTLAGPVQTIYGFHLLRVTDVRPPIQKSFEEVRDGLMRDLKTKKCGEARDAWLGELRRQANIVIPDPPEQKSPPTRPIP